MERASRNAALLQQIDQQKLRFVQDMALSDQALQENRLRLTQLQGAQAVNAEKVRTDVALEQQKYQALQSNLQALQQASTELPAVLAAINRETDPFRLRDAAIAFHGRYAHLAGDPVLGEQYKALDGRLAARLQARGEEFRARISTAADALRPYLDPGSPENLPAIRAAPLYRFARLYPTFARQIDDATQQAAILVPSPTSPRRMALLAESSAPTSSASAPAAPPSSSSEPGLSFGNAWNTSAPDAFNIGNISSRPTVDGAMAPGDLTTDGKKSDSFARPTALFGSAQQFLSQAGEQGQTSNHVNTVPPTPANGPASLGGMESVTLPPSLPTYAPTSPTPSLAPRQLTLGGRALAAANSGTPQNNEGPPHRNSEFAPRYISLDDAHYIWMGGDVGGTHYDHLEDFIRETANWAKANPDKADKYGKDIEEFVKVLPKLKKNPRR